MPSTQHNPEPAIGKSEKGTANGVASLDSNGLVPISQLPGVTQSAAGTMSASDKTKLDGVATGATAVTVSNSLSDTSTTNALSAAKGKELNDSITSLNSQIANLIKSDTYTGTSNASGYIVSNIPNTTQIIMAFTDAYPCVPLTYQGYWYFLLIDPSSGTFKTLPNTQKTVYYKYIG